MTRPNFGTAISMSKTFAVDTNSGGLSRIVSICVPRFQVALELRASDADVVRTLERLHPLIERAGRRLRVRLRRDHHESDESTKPPTLVKL